MWLVRFHFLPEKYAKKLQPCLLLESLELPQNSRLPLHLSRHLDVSFWYWLFGAVGGLQVGSGMNREEIQASSHESQGDC